VASAEQGFLNTIIDARGNAELGRRFVQLLLQMGPVLGQLTQKTGGVDEHQRAAVPDEERDRPTLGVDRVQWSSSRQTDS